MGVWGWNELVHDGSSLITVKGKVKSSSNYSGNGPTDDRDWNIDVVPDNGYEWCLSDPVHPDHTNSSGLIECEVEPIPFLDSARTINGHDNATFQRLVQPLFDQDVEISGYWARDRSHGYTPKAPSNLGNYAENGVMEIHPIRSILMVAPLPAERWEIRFFAFTDDSAEDAARALLEQPIGTEGANASHVLHRGESQTITIDVPNPTDIPGKSLQVQLLEEIVNCDEKQFSLDPATGDMRFRVITGTPSALAGHGFYYFHGLLSRRQDPPPPTSSYTFEVRDMTADTTRSRENDTNYATFGVMVVRPNGAIVNDYGTTTRPLGDMGGGAARTLGWKVSHVEVPDDGLLAFTFLVVNYGGGNPSTFAAELDAAGRLILSNGVATGIAVGVALVAWPATLVALGVDAIAHLVNLINPDCDGWVVNGTGRLQASLLKSLTAHGATTWSQAYPGYDSPAGCGRNSLYHVTYSVASDEPVKGKEGKEAKEGKEGKEGHKEGPHKEGKDGKEKDAHHFDNFAPEWRRQEHFEVGADIGLRETFIPPDDRPLEA